MKQLCPDDPKTPKEGAMVNKTNHNDEASASPLTSASSSGVESVDLSKVIKKRRSPKILLPLIRAIPEGLRRRFRSATLQPVINNPEPSTGPASTSTSTSVARPCVDFCPTSIGTLLQRDQGLASTLADFPDSSNRSSPSSSTTENGVRQFPVNRINVDPAGQHKPSYFERIQNKFTSGTGLTSNTLASAQRPKAAAPPPPPDPRPVAAKFARQRDWKGQSTGKGVKQSSGSKSDKRARQLRDLGFDPGSGAESPTPQAQALEEYELDTFTSTEPPPPDYFSSNLEETGASNEDTLLEHEIAPPEPSPQGPWEAFEPTDNAIMYNTDKQLGTGEAEQLLEEEILASDDLQPLVPSHLPAEQQEDEDETRETSIQIESMSADEDDQSSPLKPSVMASPEQTGVIISAPALVQSPPPPGPSVFLPEDKHDVGSDVRKNRNGQSKRTKTHSTMTDAGNKREKERTPMRKAKSLDAVASTEPKKRHRYRSRREQYEGKEQRDRALAKAREALARRLKQEMTAKKQEEPQKMTCRSAIEWLFDFTASCIILASLTALVFLIPFVANPALVSLDAKFSAVTDCRVCGNVTRRGMSNCTWTSCREGCTADLYSCSHIWVMYNPEPGDCDLEIPPESQELFDIGEGDCDENVPLPPPSHTPSSSSQSSSSPLQPCTKPRRARLAINALSCGYPPEVNCSFFLTETVAKVDKCQYSRRDPSLAVPTFDSDHTVRTLLLSMFVPMAATAVSSVYLCWRFCEMDTGSHPGGKGGRKKKSSRDDGDGADEENENRMMGNSMDGRADGAGTSERNDEKLKVKSKSDTDIPTNDNFGKNYDEDDEDEDEETRSNTYGTFRRRHGHGHGGQQSPSSSSKCNKHQQRQHESSTTTVSTLLGGLPYVGDVETGNVSNDFQRNGSGTAWASSSAGAMAGRASRPGSSTATTTAATTSPNNF